MIPPGSDAGDAGSPPRIALTLGDPRGIGPEVVEAVVRDYLKREPDLGILILGPSDPSFESVAFDGLPYEGVAEWDGTEVGAGRVAGRAILRGVELCLSDGADALVTGPIHKPALRAAGFDFPGHTELLKKHTGVPEVGMLMAAETTRLGAPLRVLLATTHLPLRAVPDVLTAELLVSQTRLLDRSLRHRWGLADPAIALCALNPHASDRGLFGDEETVVYGPAVERLREAGVRATGPLPADTVFSRALDREFDAVVVPYHDVGMAAFKTVSFGQGVNVTLGLPFVRTSPDHGTAFDIAGRGLADPASMGEAVALAIRLASVDPQASTGRL